MRQEASPMGKYPSANVPGIELAHDRAGREIMFGVNAETGLREEITHEQILKNYRKKASAWEDYNQGYRDAGGVVPGQTEPEQAVDAAASASDQVTPDEVPAESQTTTRVGWDGLAEKAKENGVNQTEQTDKPKVVGGGYVEAMKQAAQTEERQPIDDEQTRAAYETARTGAGLGAERNATAEREMSEAERQTRELIAKIPAEHWYELRDEYETRYQQLRDAMGAGRVGDVDVLEAAAMELNNRVIISRVLGKYVEQTGRQEEFSPEELELAFGIMRNYRGAFEILINSVHAGQTNVEEEPNEPIVVEPPAMTPGDDPKKRLGTLGQWFRHPVQMANVTMGSGVAKASGGNSNVVVNVDNRGVGEKPDGTKIVPAVPLEAKPEDLSPQEEKKEKKKRCFWPFLGGLALGAAGVGLAWWLSGRHGGPMPTPPKNNSGHEHLVGFGGHGRSRVEIPDGYQWHTNANGTHSLIDTNGHTIPMTEDSQGKLSTASERALHKHGIEYHYDVNDQTLANSYGSTPAPHPRFIPEIEG